MESRAVSVCDVNITHKQGRVSIQREADGGGSVTVLWRFVDG